jgi:hypothetical protein
MNGCLILPRSLGLAQLKYLALRHFKWKTSFYGWADLLRNNVLTHLVRTGGVLVVINNTIYFSEVIFLTIIIKERWCF